MLSHLSNRFQAFLLEPHQEDQARAVTPLTYAFIQNKVAAYAYQVVEFEYDTSKDLMPQMIEHERLKACVLVLEELMRELTPPIEATPEQSQLPI
jgi:hypothetical protein